MAPSLDTWLRQKYRHVKQDVRPKHTPITKPDRQRTARPSDGRATKQDALVAFRLWMFDAGMMANKKPEYRQQIKEACAKFDAMLAAESAKAKKHRSGRGGGKQIICGKADIPKRRKP